VNPAWLIVAGFGLAVLVLSTVVARRPTISAAEAQAVHTVNGWPGWLYPVLWGPMQLGNLVVGTVIGLVAALALGSVAAAVGVVLATGLKLVTERVVRHELGGSLSVRQRPGTSQRDAVLRGDVPRSGPSFPSGHVILVAAIGSVLVPLLPVAWWWAPYGLALVVAVGRVYVGAHNPLDVTAGLGAGLLAGCIVATFVG
jgi:membrane-associated phospholipid phosphatase